MAESDTLAQAELCVLGSMILDPRAIDPVLAIVKPSDFFYPANRIIFEHLLLMRDDDWEIGLASLNQHLAREGRIAEVGGTDYLIQLAEGVPSTAHAKHYARMVRDKARRRRGASPGTAEWTRNAAERIGKTVATMSFFEPDAARIIADEHAKAEPDEAARIVGATLDAFGKTLEKR